MTVPTWHLIDSHLVAGRFVIGIDEVGRGSWAGPVVAAAVALPPYAEVAGVNDSKQLTSAQRVSLNRSIRQQAVGIGLGWVAAHEVDEYGLSWAVQHSGLRALAQLGVPEQAVILLDGKHNYLAGYYTSETYIKGDAKIVPVAAASVLAKVARDRYMTRLAQAFPGYAFERNKGYGTALHQAGLATLGLTLQHRRSYAPLRNLAEAEGA